jgi:outer membrane protein assembly factor BamA
VKGVADKCSSDREHLRRNKLYHDRLYLSFQFSNVQKEPTNDATRMQLAVRRRGGEGRAPLS